MFFIPTLDTPFHLVSLSPRISCLHSLTCLNQRSKSAHLYSLATYMYISPCKNNSSLFILFFQLAVRTSTHNQQADLSGESVPMPGHGVNPKHKVDEDRHRRSSNEASGPFAGASTLQTVSQMPEVEPQHQSLPPAALCRAVCDFNPEELNLEDSHCCLGFVKVWLSNSWMLYFYY